MESENFESDSDAMTRSRAESSWSAGAVAGVKVVHSTFLAELDAGTYVTLIVHSESMSNQSVMLLHDSCSDALKLTIRKMWGE